MSNKLEDPNRTRWIQWVWEAPIYSDQSIVELATVLRVDVEKMEAQRDRLEAAARWYKSLSSGQHLARGGSTGLAPSEMKRRLEAIGRGAKRLIQQAGIIPDEPVEALRESQIFRKLALVAEGKDDEVAEIFRTLSRLAELAPKASSANMRIERYMVHEGNPGDIALNEWVACLLSIYEAVKGKPPTRQVGAVGSPTEGQDTGPLIAFLTEAARPLGIAHNPDAWGSRIRVIVARSTTN